MNTKFSTIKTSKWLFLFVLPLIFATSCSKDDSTTTPENAGEGHEPHPGPDITASFILPSGEQVDYAFEPSTADNYSPRFYGPNNDENYMFNSYSGFVENGINYELDLGHILIEGEGIYTFSNSSIHDEFRINASIRDADNNPGNNGSTILESYDWVEEFTLDITSFTLLDDGRQVYVEAEFSGVLTNYNGLFEQDEVASLIINDGKINAYFPLWVWTDCPCYD